jgi:anaerobic magnesium-protoporphyrin IX monomethyl ester cyclase
MSAESVLQNTWRCSMESTGRTDVILVGRKLPDNENLGLGYLLAALDGAGCTACMETLNGPRDIERICRRVLVEGPLLVGLSLPDGGSSFFALGLGELLRRRGYRGHITAGGGFATLARQWLLERYPWLDSVVRFAGELPAVQLVRSLRNGHGAGGKAAQGIPGLTTRDGDGPPAPVMDRTQVEIFPRHGDMPRILGHPMVHIAATRGCPGRCAYCGPAALQRLEWREGAAAGFSVPEIRCAGVGGVRRRDIGNLSDEMAFLWREKGVRYFYFVDEHLLPRKEADALAYLARWEKELRRRGVGELGIGCMLRADFLTSGIIGAFQEMGLVRCFLGLELASAGELRAYRRSSDVGRTLDIMASLEEMGVASICNLMLVHPRCTIESIRGGIELLGRIERGTFEATRMQVYHGTALHDMLAAEGRLDGNPLRYGYTIEDAGAARFAEIFSRLRGEAFRDFSISYHAHDIWLALRLAERLHEKAPMDGLDERARAVTRDLNLLRVRAYTGALELADAGGGFMDCRDLVRDTRKSVDEIQSRMDRIAESILGRLSRPASLYSPMRTAAAYVMKFALAGASLTGCYSSRGGEAEDVREERDAADLTTEEAELEDPDVGEEAPSCTDAVREARRQEILDIVKRVDPCLAVTIFYYPRNHPELQVYSSNRDGPTYCDHDAIVERTERIRNALSGVDLSCFDELSLSIEGGDATDFRAMEQAFGEGCPQDMPYVDDWYNVVIVIDASGRVIDVQSRDASNPAAAESLACIRQALEGLTFPCLAGYQVCPEYLIAE